MVAYLGVNVCMLAVSATLADAAVGAGLGLGLFGVLSIIRLRSTELDQHEVAVYFSSLIVAAMWVAGHPRLYRQSRRQVMVLDRALYGDGTASTLLARRVAVLTAQAGDVVDAATVSAEAAAVASYFTT